MCSLLSLHHENMYWYLALYFQKYSEHAYPYALLKINKYIPMHTVAHLFLPYFRMMSFNNNSELIEKYRTLKVSYM